MRCKACDVELQPWDLRRKSERTGEYIDLCSPCFRYIADDVELANPEVEDLSDLEEEQQEEQKWQ